MGLRIKNKELDKEHHASLTWFHCPKCKEGLWIELKFDPINKRRLKK